MSSRVHSTVSDLSLRTRTAGTGHSTTWTCARCQARRAGFIGRKRWRGMWACCVPAKPDTAA